MGGRGGVCQGAARSVSGVPAECQAAEGAGARRAARDLAPEWVANGAWNGPGMARNGSGLPNETSQQDADGFAQCGELARPIT